MLQISSWGNGLTHKLQWAGKLRPETHKIETHWELQNSLAVSEWALAKISPEPSNINLVHNTNKYKWHCHNQAVVDAIIPQNKYYTGQTFAKFLLSTQQSFQQQKRTMIEVQLEMSACLLQPHHDTIYCRSLWRCHISCFNKSNNQQSTKATSNTLPCTAKFRIRVQFAQSLPAMHCMYQQTSITALLMSKVCKVKSTTVNISRLCSQH